jgi:predicted transcriptional regulator of viral defense system
MIKTSQNLITEFAGEYAQPYHHLAFLEKNGTIFKLRRGIYETDKDADPLTLAAEIVGPSYLSFETALSYYDLIPERSVILLSASFLLHKKKRFTNRFGTFVYQDVPAKAYPFGTRYEDSNGRKFEIATPEKALCDTLCKTKVLKNVEELKTWLYSFMRMEETDVLSLDQEAIESWRTLYGKKNVALLADYLKGEKKHG